jgi:hypothetical protein
MTASTCPNPTEALSYLLSETIALLQKFGFEDRQAIIWASFSDDNCNTRVVYRSYRKNAKEEFSCLMAADLREGLADARARGLSEVLLGIDDGVLE